MQTVKCFDIQNMQTVKQTVTLETFDHGETLKTILLSDKLLLIIYVDLILYYFILH